MFKSVAADPTSTPAKVTHPVPLLLIGHGSRDQEGRDAFLAFAEAYQAFTPERPVIPCFLELTPPTIADGIQQCLEQGYQEIVAVSLLLFGARHNKFDVTVELDRQQRNHPQLQIHYGTPLGIHINLLHLLRHKLQDLETGQTESIPRSDTVVLFVGRGSSDPEANAEACKLARLLWEGSGYKAVEVCYIGITYPRLELGLERALLWQPRRLIVLPYLLFTGVLAKKINAIAATAQIQHPQVEILTLPELGIDPAILKVLQEREQEALTGTTYMNCHLCKFRLAAGESHHHHDHHHHDHHHPHSHDHSVVQETEGAYHERAWQVP